MLMLSQESKEKMRLWLDYVLTHVIQRMRKESQISLRA